MTDQGLLDEQSVLAEIAKNAKDPRVRQVAVQRMTDQSVLIDIAKNDNDKGVQWAAEQRLGEMRKTLHKTGDL